MDRQTKVEVVVSVIILSTKIFIATFRNVPAMAVHHEVVDVGKAVNIRGRGRVSKGQVNGNVNGKGTIVKPCIERGFVVYGLVDGRVHSK
jgi:hypothetical protein